jgi:methionyl aminopeptidase
MIKMGTHRVKQLKDGWSIVTLDGKPSAHYEHDVAVVNGQPEILSTFAYIYEALGYTPESPITGKAIHDIPQ